MLLLVVSLIVACGVSSESSKSAVPPTEIVEGVISQVGVPLAGEIATIVVRYKSREFTAVVGIHHDLAVGDKVNLKQFNLDTPGTLGQSSIWIASPQK